MSRHLSHDELIDIFYRAHSSSALQEHVDGCFSCRERLTEFEARRTESIPAVDLNGAELSAQRRAILERVADGRPQAMKWAPALAAGLLLATAIVSSTWRPDPAPAAKSPVAEITDEALFAEISEMELAAEPRAAAPIRTLFELEEAEGGKE